MSTRLDLVFSNVLSELRHDTLSTDRDILVMKISRADLRAERNKRGPRI